MRFPIPTTAMLLVAFACESARADDPIASPPLAGTAPLEWTGDLASRMVDGCDQFLLRAIADSAAARERHWTRNSDSPAEYTAALLKNRQRLRRLLGCRDPRPEFDGLTFVATTAQPALVGQAKSFDVFAVQWPAVEGVYGHGLLLVPKGRKSIASVVCLPDCEQTPEMLAGLAPGIPVESQFARRLAESGCRVIVPALIDRGSALSQVGDVTTKITHREFLYRPSFELGRHIIGYELQKVLALVDWLESKGGSSASTGVVGYGEGGLLALYAGAVDPRIDIVGVSGYFDSRQNIWQEPLDRNVFGLLTEFGDAEAASMVAPRRLVVEACAHPAVVIPPGTGGGPGRIETPALKTVTSELERAIALQGSLDAPQPKLIASGDGSGPFGTAAFLAAILQGLAPQATLATTESTVKHLRTGFDPQLRLRTQFDEINRHTQRLLAESPHARAEFMASADRASRDPAKYLASTKSFRDYFRDRVVGRFDVERLSLNPRTRQVFDSPKYTGYEVVIDVFPDVFAYGIYLLPKGIPLGERRPVVVCQHGLEGRPRDVVQGDHRAYHDFAAKLAERGFVVFAPQNLYIFGDRFRTLQRKANAIEKTLFAIMAPQHQAIVDWLRTQPQVDPARIGFYGLSYGGKSAMRIPPLVDGYCLSICSADFNDWVWKNASTRSHYSYVRTGEYEIFEWDLGNTFNYAEMAGLICPRPFMVERGHRDGVAPDDRVAAEYAKIRLLYADLKIPERTEIEFFDGPHTIHGKGTFEFLHRHLEWPLPKEE